MNNPHRTLVLLVKLYILSRAFAWRCTLACANCAATLTRCQVDILTCIARVFSPRDLSLRTRCHFVTVRYTVQRSSSKQFNSLSDLSALTEIQCAELTHDYNHECIIVVNQRSHRACAAARHHRQRYCICAVETADADVLDATGHRGA